MLRAALAEPRAPGAPRRVWRDWVVVAGFAVAAVVEALVSPDLTSRSLNLAVTLGLLPVLLWRRTHPLASTLTLFGAVLAADAALRLAGREPLSMGSMVYALIVVYALFRWGSGREAAIGLAAVLVTAISTTVLAWSGVVDAIGGVAIVLATAEAGIAVRSRLAAQERAVAQAKADERMQLARELHDTVAHHVSAIAVQAQAGQAMADTDPGYPREALSVIEAEAGRTLAEMQSLVRVLREETAADYAPQPGVRDLPGLAGQARPGSPPVQVDVDGDMAELPLALEAALFRIAQEAVTNARRHARDATLVRVQVEADQAQVRLRVTDDGVAVNGASGVGFGLLGMSERAALLGGTCTAGPVPADGRPGRGWVVEASLPRRVAG